MTPLPVISCDSCGKCCSMQGTPPMLPDEFDALPTALKWDRRANADRYDLNLPCLWFDVATKRCRHYDHRPIVCREFETGGEDCLRFRDEP